MNFESENNISNSNISYNAYPSNSIKKQKEKKYYPVTKDDYICFGGVIAILFAVARFGVLNSFNFGFSVFGVLLVGASFAYSYNKNSNDKIFNALLLICTVAVVSTFSLNSDYLLKFLSFLFVVFLYVLMVTGASGNSFAGEGTYFYIADSVKKAVNAVFKNLILPYSCVKQSVKEKKSSTAISLLTGAVIAVPLLCIILPLLASSDVAFGNMVSAIFKNIAEIVGSLVLTAIFTPLVFALLFSMKKEAEKDKGLKNKTKGKISTVLINTTLSAVCIVYIAYLFSQLAYISDAFSFLLPENYTAAEFARSGFFQMAVIALINCVVIAVSAALVKCKENGKLPSSTKALLTFLCCFTVFYISTAFVKMMKYISLYGLTWLRVLTSAFMLMLAVIFVIILIKLFVTKFKYVKAVILVCAATLIAVTAVDINTVIAEYNYNAYKAGKIDIDIEQISSLGVSSIPTLVKLAEDENEEIAYFATDELLWVSYQIYENAFNTENIKEEGLIPVKTSIFEKNRVWNNSKEALDIFIENHPELDKSDFTDWYYNEYLTDSNPEESSEEIIGSAESEEQIIVA